MKKIIVIIAMLSFKIYAVAQSQDTTKKFHPADQNTKDSRYCAVLLDGKITLITEGKPVNAEVSLDNGTKISLDGTVTKKDGSKVVLENGACIDRDGNIDKPGQEKSIENKQERKQEK